MGSKNHILWLLCGGAALALHAGAAALFFGGAVKEKQPIGQKGVLVELAFEGTATGGKAQAGNVTEEVSSHTVSNEAQSPKRAETATPQKAVAADAVKPKPKPSQAEPEPLAHTMEPTPVDAPIVEGEPEQIAPAEDTAIIDKGVGTEGGAEIEAVTKSVGGAGGANAVAQGTKGNGNAAQSGGLGGVIKSYEDLVQVWVHKHLLYPKTARKRRLTGTVLVRFTLSPDGRLLAAEIVKESSYRILDKSALKTIKRAVPFPAFPKELPAEAHVFLIPIEYQIG